MSSDELKDYGTIDPSGGFTPHIGHSPRTHEELVELIRHDVLELVNMITEINGRTARIEQKLDNLSSALDGLGRMIARSPNGFTLINMVERIMNKVGA